MKKIKYISALLTLLISCNIGFAQDWEIPEDVKTLTNPLEITSEVTEQGLDLYNTHCKSCHGDVGQGNFLSTLNPVPSDLGTESFKSSNSGGEIFYKITEGKVTMPSFKTTLSEEERWAIVTYLKPENTEANTEEDVSTAKNVSLSVQTNDEKKSVVVSLWGEDEEGNAIKVKGAKVEVYAKRIFGNLLLGKGKSNKNGMVAVEFPTDLPGDTAGMVKLIVLVPDFKKEETLDVKWGVPVKPKKFTEQASLWGTNANAPWWIILLYVGIAGAVWTVIVYIVFRIIRIKKLSK